MLCVMLIGRFPFEGTEMSHVTNLDDVSEHVSAWLVMGVGLGLGAGGGVDGRASGDLWVLGAAIKWC